MPGPHGLGAHPSPADPRDYLLADLLRARAARPVAFAPTSPADAFPMDASFSPMPAPYDQGVTPWCAPEAVTGGLAGLERRRTGRWLFDQGSVADLYALAKDVDGLSPGTQGTTLRACLAQAQHVGIRGVDGRRYRIGAYHSIPPGAGAQGLIEQAIATLDQPVVVALPWPGNWYTAETYPLGVLPDPPNLTGSPGGHAVLLFRYAMGHPAPGMALLELLDCLRCAWGEAWGNGHGDAYARAASLLALLWECFTFTL